MKTVAVQKIEKNKAKPALLFQEIEKQFEEVRRRAFDIFEKRGQELGYALEDWLKAEHEVMGWPAAELTEADSKYDLAMTLPGYEPKDIQVTITPSEIIVHAQVESKKKTEEAKCVWTEFQSNDIYRHFTLPEAINVDKTTASLDKGMLHITAAKMPNAKSKSVEVKIA